MSISNYSELKTAVANWLDRADLSAAMIIDLITAGEIRLYDDIKIRAMENEMSTTLTSGDIEIDYPSGAIGFKDALYIIDDDTRVPITQVSEEWSKTNYTDTDSSTNTGRPEYFYLTHDDKIHFNLWADEDYTVKAVYFKRLTLSTSSDTNWVLTNFPMVLLYATLLEAQVLLEDDPRRYEVMYEEQLRRIRRRAQRERYGAVDRTFKQVSLGTGYKPMGLTPACY